MEYKVAIGVPTTGSIKATTVISLLSIIWNTPNVNFHLIINQGCYVHENREKIALDALEAKCTHLLFVDSDMYFKEDALTKLLEQDKDVIGANYNQRQIPLVSTVKIEDKDGNFMNCRGDEIPTVPFKCGALGTGFLLINMKVFEKMEKPWFYFNTKPGELVGNNIHGEDIWFCKQARKAGFEVWCDPTLFMGHCGDYVY
jgi:hypothetical protein